MNYFTKVTLLICCLAFCTTTKAQSALEKAETYAKMDAPFLSIKYLQKHINKQKNDRSAMRLLANTYLKVNMASQGQKWLLKANNIPIVISYFQRINERLTNTRNDVKTVSSESSSKTEDLSKPASTVVLPKDHLMMVANLNQVMAVII
ncbi:MAG: hypothetical protein AB8F74_20775 [Saprospiraceae bacterium]